MRIEQFDIFSEKLAREVPAFRFVTEVTLKDELVRTVHLVLGPDFGLDPGLWPILAHRIETILSGQGLLFPPQPMIEEMAREIADKIMADRALAASGGEIPGPWLDSPFEYLVPDGSPPAGDRPFGLAWMAMNALKETYVYDELRAMKLLEGTHGLGLAGALIAARLEHPADLAETRNFLRTGSGIPALFGLEAMPDWDRPIEHIMELMAENRLGLPGRLDFNDDLPDCPQHVVLTYDPTRNFLDGPPGHDGPASGPAMLVPFEAMGYVLGPMTPPEKLGFLLDEGLTPDTLDAILEEDALTRGDEDFYDIHLLAPWDRHDELLPILDYHGVPFMAVRRVPLPKAGTFETPPPGRLAKATGQRRTFVWGCPGYGPLLDDLAMEDAEVAERFPDLLVPKGLAAFQVTIHENEYQSKPARLLPGLLKQVLQIGSRFRHLALPGFPLGQARTPAASPRLQAAQSTLGLMAYQCLNYIRNVFVSHRCPFDWQAAKRLLNTQAVPPSSGRTLAADFGRPSPRVRKIQEIFDLLERPFLNPRLRFQEHKDADIARQLLQEEMFRDESD
ncbi:MAG: hypothetical protein LBP92_09145 [Deltaproteobacteria bacterium]|jgi:hypothetical protein|nr:hypothetical protein [Deltaproteobacteria bacterium]